MLHGIETMIKSFKSVIKNNNGSTLVVSILIIILMSLLGISLIAVTMSSLDMTIFYSDVNRAYFLAEAAAEEIARNLDEIVAKIQEEAREQATLDIQMLLEENPIYYREPDGSLSLATSEPTYNLSKLEKEFENKYLTYFNSDLDSEFSDISDLDRMKEVFKAEDDDGNYVFKDMENDQGRMIFKSASYNDSDSSLSITVSGIYKGYEKKLYVKFSLLPESEKIPYRTVEKYSIKNSEKYDILKKAVVTEKNMITSGGNVVITGDVVCFGTVPYDADNEEDQDAEWYKYGGIMVGMCTNVASRSADFDFDSSRTGHFSNGSLTINGNAATMSYIHTLYGTGLDKSSIRITGDSFARSIRAEKYSNNSNFDLNNLTVLDNLQIDSNNTTFNVSGIFNGLVDSWHAIDGIGGGSDAEDELKPKRTSSIIVNGDSFLNLNSEVYIGGSAFLKNYTDASGNPYMTGVSALKSTMRLSNAFIKGDESNPGNKVFWYEDSAYVSPDPDAQYRYYNSNSVEMINGRITNPDYFPIEKRAMHLKGVWENLWKNNELYSTYLNPFNINIAVDNGKLKGYSNGAIVANGTVYGVYDFNTQHDPSWFHQSIQIPGLRAYHNQMKGLLKNDFNENAPKLSHVFPTRKISDYFDTGYVGNNKILKNTIYLPVDYLNKGFVYYGDSDIEISKLSGSWRIGTLAIPVAKGFICTEGDITIDDGFNFTGIIYAGGNIYVDKNFNLSGSIMSAKNIVFLGNSTITYNESAIDDIINSDVNVNGLFGLLSYETSEEAFKSQRVTTRNIKVIKWNEIK